MAVDTATTISAFNVAAPASGDPKSEGDDNFRHIKTVVKNAFPNVAGAVTATHTELNYVDGVTSAIQTQFTAKANLAGAPTFANFVFVGTGATSNPYINQGIGVLQDTQDDEALTLSSNDVAHGITTDAWTKTFGVFKKYHATNGGVRFTGYSGSTVGIGLRGVVTTEDATRSTAAVAPVMIAGAVKSGTTSAAMTANQNVVVITDGTNARFIFDSDGDSHQDVGTAWTNYDHLDDVATLDAIAYNVARADDPIKVKFGEWMNERRDVLTDQKLVKFNDNGHHFVNMSKLTMLHTGAIRQMGEKLEAAMQMVGDLTEKLQQLEHKNA